MLKTTIKELKVCLENLNPQRGEMSRWDEDAPSWLTATEYMDNREVAAIKVKMRAVKFKN